MQMGNSGFYQVVFKGKWKFPQVRAMTNFAKKLKMMFLLGSNMEIQA